MSRFYYGLFRFWFEIYRPEELCKLFLHQFGENHMVVDPVVPDIIRGGLDPLHSSVIKFEFFFVKMQKYH